MKTSVFSRRRQQGAVLLISLLLLIVMALLGVTSLANVVMEEELARSYQHSVTAFQIAESVIERVIRLSDSSASGYVEADDLTVTARTNGTSSATADYAADPLIDPTTDTLDVTTATAAATLQTWGLAEGYTGEFANYVYYINSTVGLNSTGASTVHRQGVQRIGPAPP